MLQRRLVGQEFSEVLRDELRISIINHVRFGSFQFNAANRQVLPDSELATPFAKYEDGRSRHSACPC